MSKRSRPISLVTAAADVPREVHLTLGQLADALPVLQYLAQQLLSQKIAYDVGRLSSLAETEIREYEKQRKVLVERYGEKRDTTDRERAHGHTAKTITAVKEECQEAFQAELDQLRRNDVTLTWRPIVLERLRSPMACPCGEHKPLDMTSGHMMALYPLSYGEPAEDRCECIARRRAAEAQQGTNKHKGTDTSKPERPPTP